MLAISKSVWAQTGQYSTRSANMLTTHPLNVLSRTSVNSWFVIVLAATSACRSGSSSAAPSAPSTSTTAKLAISRNSYNFPNTNVGDTQQSPALDVSATGTGSLTVSSVTSSNPSEFPLVNEASCIGTSLNSSTNCQIAVKFKPSAAGVRTAQVTVAGNDGSNVVVAVFGTGLGSSSSGGGDAGGGAGGGGGGGGGSTGGGGSSTSGGSFPQPPCVPNNTQNISLSIVNTTSIVIQVSATGTTRYSQSIDPGHIWALQSLDAGNYTLDGSAPGTPNVSFVPSTWTVVRGCDYLMQVVSK
jgi:hypothetical protein